MFEIRPAQVSDLKRLHEIEVECFGAEGVTPQQLNWILEKQGENPVIFISVATDPEKSDQVKDLLGFICWKSQTIENGQHFEILDLGVSKLYRREGVAQELIMYLLARAKAEKFLGIVVYLSEGNPPARALYEKLGFQTQRVMKAYYQDGTNALLMVLATSA